MYIDKRWEYDDDSVRITYFILFIYFFCLITKRRLFIIQKDIDIFYSNDYGSYHWGKKFFDITISYLKQGFCTSRKLLSYNLRGFNLTFQILFYKCCFLFLFFRKSFRIGSSICLLERYFFLLSIFVKKKLFSNTFMLSLIILLFFCSFLLAILLFMILKRNNLIYLMILFSL